MMRGTMVIASYLRGRIHALQIFLLGNAVALRHFEGKHVPTREMIMPIRLALMCAAALFCVLSMAADGPRAAAPKAAGVTIYDADPQHLLNRLHRAMAVRTIGGVDYGTDNAIPFLGDADALLSGDAHVQLLSVLDEFLRTQT